MDLRSIANSASSTINPNVAVVVRRSTGYTIGAGRKQVPTYAAALDADPAGDERPDGRRRQQARPGFVGARCGGGFHGWQASLSLPAKASFSA